MKLRRLKAHRKAASLNHRTADTTSPVPRGFPPSSPKVRESAAQTYALFFLLPSGERRIAHDVHCTNPKPSIFLPCSKEI
jgi:hypothetical protein